MSGTPARIDPLAVPVSAGGRQLLDTIFREGGISQAALTRRLGLAQPTVARLLQGYVGAGLVTLEARRVDRPGHPSATARIDPSFASSLGAAILNDVVSLTLLDCAGGVLGERRAAMPNATRDRVAATLCDFRDELVTESGVDPHRILGLGVGISAFFTGDGGKMVGPPALEDWTMIEIAPFLQDALGLPTIVENDGAAGAVGESLFGVGRTVRDFAYLHLTNGFGGGIVSDGRLFRGARGNAGEFGGIWTVGALGYPNLDRLLALVRDGGAGFADLEAMLPEIALTTPGVARWLDEAVPAFATLSAILGYAIDPQAVVIGGRLPAAVADALVARITLPRAPNRHGAAPPVPVVMRSQVAGDAVALGAAIMPIQRAFLA
ncbi:transcriptional regulator [Sphingomonas sp. Leaf17]|uniref:ROK family transcriptional regulator n=1 Tax=Sphingomonas sp. Leaf17 TaxID=1735683 RepID=UPI0006F4B0DC|nr:ROK family transcriptional regulator [Sphingomonas sp. Leaf17]KQM67993.1 transcriptional regulator [Sphingomonas sp. Leaf17]